MVVQAVGAGREGWEGPLPPVPAVSANAPIAVTESLMRLGSPATN